jgi:hypothetical protein
VDADVFSKILGDDTFLEGSRVAKGGQDEANEDDEDDDAIGMGSIPVIPTAHSRDAVDYSDFDETVPDDQDRFYRRGMGMLQKSSLPRSRLAYSDNYDEDEEEEGPAAVVDKPVKQELDLQTVNNFDKDDALSIIASSTKPAPMDIDHHEEKVDIQELFPGFEKGKILKFSELFMAKIKRPPKLQPHKRGKKKSRNNICI